MKCPECFAATRVVDVRERLAGVYRKRKCEGCGSLSFTLEKITRIDPLHQSTSKGTDKPTKSRAPLSINNFRFKDTQS